MLLLCKFQPKFGLNSKRFVYNAEKAPGDKAPVAPAAAPKEMYEGTKDASAVENKKLADEFEKKYDVIKSPWGKILNFQWKEATSTIHYVLHISDDGQTMTVTKKNLTEPSLPDIVTPPMKFSRFNVELQADKIPFLPELRARLEASRDKIVISSELSKTAERTLNLYRHHAAGEDMTAQAQTIRDAIDANYKTRLAELAKDKTLKANVKNYQNDYFPGWTKYNVKVNGRAKDMKKDAEVDTSSLTEKFVLEMMFFARLRDNFVSKKYKNFSEFVADVDAGVKQGLKGPGEQKATIFIKGKGAVPVSLKDGKVTCDYAKLQARILDTDLAKDPKNPVAALEGTPGGTAVS